MLGNGLLHKKKMMLIDYYQICGPNEMYLSKYLEANNSLVVATLEGFASHVPGLFKKLMLDNCQLPNIPILPEAFLTFASKSSVGPSYSANGQEDHKTLTNLNGDTIIMMTDCYFEIQIV